MNLKQLAYLAALHKTHSFTQAAKQCGVSQSTLSGGIAALEATLGAALVERDKQHVLFTPLGQGVVARAAPMLAAGVDLQAYVASGANPLQGSVVLGAIPSIAPFLLTALLQKTKAQYPQLTVQLREMQTAPLLAALRDGALDLGLIALPYDTAGLAVQPLFQEPLMLIASAKDALAKIAQPTLANLVPERLILLEEGHCLRDHTLQSCTVQERSSAAIEASSLLTLVQMVNAGLGVALLPEMAVRSPLVQPLIDSGSLVAHAFAKPAPQRGVALVARATHTLGAAFDAVASLSQAARHMPV